MPKPLGERVSAEKAVESAVVVPRRDQPDAAEIWPGEQVSAQGGGDCELCVMQTRDIPQPELSRRKAEGHALTHIGEMHGGDHRRSWLEAVDTLLLSVPDGNFKG